MAMKLTDVEREITMLTADDDNCFKDDVVSRPRPI